MVDEVPVVLPAAPTLAPPAPAEMVRAAVPKAMAMPDGDWSIGWNKNEHGVAIDGERP
jgi:hypothetical protein